MSDTPPNPAAVMGQVTWCDATLPGGAGESWACHKMAHDYPAVKHATTRREPPCPECGGFEDHRAECDRGRRGQHHPQNEVTVEW